MSLAAAERPSTIAPGTESVSRARRRDYAEPDGPRTRRRDVRTSAGGGRRRLAGSARRGPGRGDARRRPDRRDQDADVGLVRRIVRGDSGALGELYDRFGRPAYSLARRICADDGLAEDVVQEVFLAFWRDPRASTRPRASSAPGC